MIRGQVHRLPNQRAAHGHLAAGVNVFRFPKKELHWKDHPLNL